MMRNPDVVRVSTCAWSPVNIVSGFNMRSSIMPEDRQLVCNGSQIDQDYIATTGLKIVAGEGITRQDMRNAHPWEASGGKDTVTKPNYAFVLNETAARQLGWSPQEAIGKRMFMDESRPGFVRAVVKDFNYQSLHTPIRALVLFPQVSSRNMLVRITGSRLSQTLEYLEATWKRVAPGIPYEAHFLDESYNHLYAAEERLGTVMNLFSAIAVVLACLGLYGLSSYSAKQRMKEIGVRKVLGAGTMGLVVLLAGSFGRLAGVAMVVAMPLAAWAMHRWLQDFVYRTGMEWWVFVAAGLIVLVVTMAALVNPIKSLRSE
jgi:putative ABC transport system permease protein